MKRFWEKVDQSGDCWEWKATKQPKGYGLFGLEGQSRLAHRVAYELTIGPIPEGLVIDHLCRNRSCVNPAHMEPVTSRENTLRGKTLAAENVKKTHCPKGHPYAGENLYIQPRTGKRFCRACAHARWLDKKAEHGKLKRKGEDND